VVAGRAGQADWQAELRRLCPVARLA